MLNFFRKIRQKLLTENQFSKYLLYAIGEIVLVVIGILIALSINNWNEERKQNIKRIELARALLQSFEQNEAILDGKIIYTDKLIQRLDRFLEISDKPHLRLPLDSIKHYASAAFLSNSLQLQLETYTQAINTGELALINNDSLKSHFTEFQRNLNFYAEHTNISANEFYQGGIYEIRKEMGNLYNLDEHEVVFATRRTFDAHKMDYEELLEFINRKDVFAVFHNQVTIQYNYLEALGRLSEMSEKIIQELKLELAD